MGEFGAVSVVSGHVRGLTNTMPLYVEILYNDYQFVPAFAVASLLTFLALVTLVAKSLVEWKSERKAADLKARSAYPATHSRLSLLRPGSSFHNTAKSNIEQAESVAPARNPRCR